MRLTLVQLALRATCGVGLLVGAAVQQKVCTLPRSTRAVAPDPQARTERGSRKRPVRLELASLVPDVAPPKWPGHLHLSAAVHKAPLPAATWRTDAGSEGAEQAGAAIGCGPEWNTLLAALVAWTLPDEPAQDSLTGRLLRASIMRTGPPAA